MLLFFHFVPFGLDSLRFEANFGLALIGAEFSEVVDGLVEEAFVGIEVAKVEGKLLIVSNGAGIGIHAGVLESLSPLGEPVGLGHGDDKNALGFVGWLMLVEEFGLETFKVSGIFRGEEFEIFLMVPRHAVGGVILSGDGLGGFRFCAGRVERIATVGLNAGL